MRLLSLAIDDPTTNGVIRITPPIHVPVGGLESGEFNKYLGNGIFLIFVGATLLSLTFLVWGGLSWILSGGDKTKVLAARNRIVYAIIGLVICFLAFAIVSFIGTIFQVELL